MIVMFTFIFKKLGKGDLL